MSKATINFKGKEFSREMLIGEKREEGGVEISCFPPREGGLIFITKEEYPDDTFADDIIQRIAECEAESICKKRIDGDTCRVTGNKCDDYGAMFCKACVEV